MISPVADGVDEGGLALLDLLDGALERRFQIVGIIERAFGIPAHRTRDPGTRRAARARAVRREETPARVGC